MTTPKPSHQDQCHNYTSGGMEKELVEITREEEKQGECNSSNGLPPNTTTIAVVVRNYGLPSPPGAAFHYTTLTNNHFTDLLTGSRAVVKLVVEEPVSIFSFFGLAKTKRCWDHHLSQCFLKEPKAKQNKVAWGEVVYLASGLWARAGGVGQRCWFVACCLLECSLTPLFPLAHHQRLPYHLA